MTDISFNIWSVIILIGSAQGLFVSVLLFVKSAQHKANRWLAFLLLAVSLHLLEYAANISAISLRYPIIIASSYPLLFCMGPAFYLYCRSLLIQESMASPKAWFHFIPSVLVLLFFAPFYAMPGSEKVGFISGLAKNGVLDVPPEQLVFMGAHVVQTVVYLILSYNYIRKNQARLKEYSADAGVLSKQSWLRGFTLFFAIYMFLYMVLVIVLSIANSHQVQIDYVMLLITSFSLYMVGYGVTANPELFKGMSLKDVAKKPAKPERIGSKNPELKQELLTYMTTNKPYLKSDLKISELADTLSVPYYQLSQLINDEFSVNFYDFINAYRVDEAKRLLVEDTRNFKILAIAYEVGFNSKATFNRVFKKTTGYTPSEYKLQHD